MSGWVAGAVVVAGVAGSVIASNKAASATQAGANTAATAQETGLTQELAVAQPYRVQGQQGIQTYNNLTSASPGQVQATLQGTPGYQATYGQGVEAAERAAGASGLNLSGNQIAGVESFGAQLGDSTYQQAINNALGQEQIGQAAAAGSAANISSTAGNLSNIAINQGTNLANISSNEIAGITRAGSGAANQYLTYNTLQNLNNPAGGSPTYNTTGYSGANFDGSGGGVPAATYNTPPPGGS